MSQIKRRTFMIRSVTAAAALVGFGDCELGFAGEEKPQAHKGCLRVHPDNPRYFADGSGLAILLTGSHVWNNLVDMGPGYPPPQFDFAAYLKFLEKYNHNFFRLWTWEHTAWDTSTLGKWAKNKPHNVTPHPWVRTGPGTALDGKAKFDLTKFNPEYFKRLRSRVVAAGKRGIYVSVMLFEGWAMQNMPGAWESHPFHPKNNINGIDGDANGDGRGLEIHTLTRPEVTRLQEAYVRKVIDTVGDLDNVLYEISNENHPESTLWQYHMIRFIKKYEKARPKKHPVGMTFQYKGGENKTLFKSPADWISPNDKGGYYGNPPVADGRKVVLVDTDHLWGIGGNQGWVWKIFLRGLNPIFMDPYDGVALGKPFDPQWEPIRRSMGYARQFAERLNLAACRPGNELASTGYCLANPGREYLAYLPDGGKVTVDLTATKRQLAVEWFDPSVGKTAKPAMISGGARRDFSAPFSGDAVLYIHSVKEGIQP